MAERLLKTKKQKIASAKPTAEEPKKVVLVGTYAGSQLADWPGYYPYPLSSDDKVDAESCAKVNEIWLFKGTKEPKYFAAEFVGIKNREGLKALGYPAKGKGHGDGTYLLFKIEKTYAPASSSAALATSVESVIVRTKDFARSPKVRKQLKAYLESTDRADKELDAQLPSIITKLPSQILRVCEVAVQLDFLGMFERDVLEVKVCISHENMRRAREEQKPTCVEICAGAGGQAIGLERAGFAHVALVEYESEYCDVLRNNNPNWNVICADVHKFDGHPYEGVDLFAGGVPCPPFSVASKQLGEEDERDLFPEAIRLIGEIKPKAVMIENVRGLLDPKFDEYRNLILQKIDALGYDVQIKLLHASDFGVPQIRPRVVIVGIKKSLRKKFVYPEALATPAPTVGEALGDLMGANGWRGVDAWKKQANSIAPTVVGGSKKHGGPDLGPTRARRAWAALSVDGLGIANEAPTRDFVGSPKLTKEMIAVIQGFPKEWNFGKKKTAACRMIGNAFPPPVAMAVGQQIMRCLQDEK